MLTEQEVVAQLNELIAKNSIKPSTSRYLAKIKDLKSILEQQRAELESLKSKIESVEDTIQRSKGAISILLELSAEDEGMLTEVAETPKTPE